MSRSSGTLKNSTNPELAPCTDASKTHTGLATPQTIFANIHDGTVISPYVANDFRYPESTSLMHYAPLEAFPIFQGGDVHVKSSFIDPPKQWRLHSAILARHSPWFARSLQQERRSEDDGPTWFSYTIEEVEGKIGLVRQQITGEQPDIEARDDGGIDLGTAVKVEETDDTILATKERPASIPVSGTTRNATHVLSGMNHSSTMAIYSQIFGTFYSIPPSISTASIAVALTQSEQLAEIAQNLGCLHLITSHIGNALFSYRQSLFSAIKADPARWILLSMLLQNDSIYTEALIHLAGAHPCWPWPTKRTVVPGEIRRLIMTKSRALDRLCLEAERELLLLTIYVRSKPVQPQEKSQFDTWFIVQNFRDILAREFNTLENDRKKSMRRGAIFRKIRKGGSLYMSYEEMRRLMERIMPSAVDNLSEDLTLLKKHASGIVEELAANELMLDVEANHVGYLTCTKVGDEDILWRAGQQSEA
ncbi:uncharacterized protein K460DRAFT_412639 [Cucurbitaria berberidis CBS 394.84]|uniref:Uncharacterized protein n=1 Tax=Cucurbitaria berberidis CBS 394.84 TaxID=1168544 RepID=A0A9P4LCQ2_9PLEO|nr:uncharacterized protein K460DRAFT_412639 [Cucurbitaria berberidis CBS 394.84]KAF1851016.1 hypothetical protein K460DRAFT_412639 [Cucurbitaria berberidis CBS 394.84]